MIREVDVVRINRAINNWRNGLLDEGTKLYAKDGNTWVALNNSTGECWVEEFDTEEETIRWLNM